MFPPTKGIIMKEKYYCKNCKEEVSKYNKSGLCRSCVQKGKKASKESKKKMSLNKTGNKNSFFGKYHTKEAKEKNSLAHKDKKLTESHKLKISLNNRRGMLDKYHTIETKEKMKENHADFSGENHPQFGKLKSFETRRKISLAGGGTGVPYEFSEYPKEFNSKLKEEIRERDNYECQNCDMTEEESLIVYRRVLDVHHIDYNKKNCNKLNLISSRQPCNLRFNYNREYWMKYFKEIIEHRELELTIN